MIVLQPVLAVAALETRVEGIRRIGRDLAAEKVEREREREIGLFVYRRQADDAKLARLLDLVGIADPRLLHRFARALDDARDAGLAHEHVVRFFREHEAAGARERIETRLRGRPLPAFSLAGG